jgi:hypothetical protein
LEAAIPTPDPAEVTVVAHKALASALKFIARADDSSGIIGDACRRLLELHPTAAAAAQVPASSLADWMMRFQFEQAEPQILTILHPASRSAQYLETCTACGRIIEVSREQAEAAARQVGPELR